MLDFTDFFTKGNSWEMSNYRSEFKLDCHSSGYLIAVQNHKRHFIMENSIYVGFFRSFGENFLKMAKSYAKQHYDKMLSGKTSKETESNLYSNWKSLYKLLNVEQWNSMLAHLLKQNTRKMQTPKKNVFEKRLNILCQTLELCDINKELLRLLYLCDYNESVKCLFDGITEAINTSRHRISYSAMGIFANVPEETVLEALSKERGLINLNILNSSERNGVVPKKTKNPSTVVSCINKKPYGNRRIGF